MSIAPTCACGMSRYCTGKDYCRGKRITGLSIGGCAKHPGQNMVNCPLCAMEKSLSLKPSQMDIDAYVGKKIQERRKPLKYSQEEIASAVCLTRTSIVNIEAGRQKISVDVLLKICAILKCEVMDILPPIPTVTIKKIKEETQIKVVTKNKLKSEFEW